MSERSSFTDWVGRSEQAQDIVTFKPVAALNAMFDLDPSTVAADALLPPLWHWLYFLPTARQSELGPDGHPRRGGFLPPIPLPRRMWAGSDITFHHPIRIGDTLERVSTIDKVTEKQGRTGRLVFVRVKHELSVAKRGDLYQAQTQPLTQSQTESATNINTLCITEYHDIVYRDNPKPGADAIQSAKLPAEKPSWRRTVVADDVLLFRYSALTFNGHRIHYDRRYATDVESYPGLVVHGPLIATLLLQTAMSEIGIDSIKDYSFRAVQPVFDAQPLYLCGKTAERNAQLWAESSDGAVTMQATLSF